MGGVGGGGVQEGGALETAVKKTNQPQNKMGKGGDAVKRQNVWYLVQVSHIKTLSLSFRTLINILSTQTFD